MSEAFSFSRTHESSCLVWSITLRSEMKRMLFSLATAKVDLAKVSGAVVSLKEKELFHWEKNGDFDMCAKNRIFIFWGSFYVFTREKWFSARHCALFFIYFVRLGLFFLVLFLYWDFVFCITWSSQCAVHAFVCPLSLSLTRFFFLYLATCDRL